MHEFMPSHSEGCIYRIVMTRVQLRVQVAFSTFELSSAINNYQQHIWACFYSVFITLDYTFCVDVTKLQASVTVQKRVHDLQI